MQEKLEIHNLLFMARFLQQGSSPLDLSYFPVYNEGMGHGFSHVWIAHQLSTSLQFGPRQYQTSNVKIV